MTKILRDFLPASVSWHKKVAFFQIAFVYILLLQEYAPIQKYNIDWATINKKLPTGDSAQEIYLRRKYWWYFDPNGNGILSLAEIDRGIRDVLRSSILFRSKPAIMRAFQAAKASIPSNRGSLGDDYVEEKEFHFFLLLLRQYFEYWVAYMRVDVDDDRRLSLQEWKDHHDKMVKWVGPFDAEVEFQKIDINNGGMILFNEFCEWALSKDLDLPDDVDYVY